MTGEAMTAAELGTAPSPAPAHGAETRLSPGAASHLAHEFRASLHSILGYAVLLEADADAASDRDTLESAARIREAATRLGHLCEDVVDALRPIAPDAESAPVALDIEGIVASLVLIAQERGLRVRVLDPHEGFDREGGSNGSAPGPAVHARHRRVLSHLLGHLARYATGDVTLGCALRNAGDYVITVSPLPDGFVATDDGVFAIATRLLVDTGGAVRVAGRRLELTVPAVA